MQKSKVVEKSGRPSQFPVAKVRGLIRVNGIYQFQGKQVKGVRPPRVSLHTRDFGEAVAKALQMSKTTDRKYVAGTWEFEINRYVEERKLLKKSRWTWEADESALNVFAEFAGPASRPASITTGKVEEWRNALRKAGKSEPTVKTYLDRLRAFYVFLDLTHNPVVDVELPVVKTTKADRFCTREERDLLIDLCDKIKAPAATREGLKHMLMLGFHAGLRVNEMIQMRTEWVQLWDGGGEIRVQETATFKPKGKKSRRIPMNALLLQYFRELQAADKLKGTYVVRDDVEPGESKYRWEPRKAFARLRADAGLKWVGWHTLRHTFATQLVLGNCPIASVAKWLGDDIKTTYNTYTGYSSQADHVNAGITVAAPAIVPAPKPKGKGKGQAA